jgi:DNA-binding transcriptional regulator YiaG
MRKNAEARRAALERVMGMGEAPIRLDASLEIPEEDPTQLEGRVNHAYLEATVGELLEAARRERGLGKREFARVLGTTHGRVGQLEQADNLELKSVLETAAALEYDLELSLIPRAGGRTLGAVVRLGTQRV